MTGSSAVRETGIELFLNSYRDTPLLEDGFPSSEFSYGIGSTPENPYASNFLCGVTVMRVGPHASRNRSYLEPSGRRSRRAAWPYGPGDAAVGGSGVDVLTREALSVCVSATCTGYIARTLKYFGSFMLLNVFHTGDFAADRFCTAV